MAEDLALARACLAGDPSARRELDVLLRTEAERACARVRRPELVDDVHRALADAIPLAEYDGRSELSRWLRVAAIRTAHRIMHGTNCVRTDHDADAIEAFIDPELAILHDRYRDVLQHALRASFDALDSARDRNLVRLHFVDRISPDRLGQMYGVPSSTISRWLSTLRETILTNTHARLAEAIGMTAYRDVITLVESLRGEIDMTLSRMLRPKSS